MLLYHLTSCPSRRGIELEGFVRQARASHPGLASFSFDQQAHVRVAREREWWVIVDLPDDEAELARSPVIGAFLVPVEQANLGLSCGAADEVTRR